MLFMLRTREEQKYKKRIEGKEEEWTSVVSSSGEEVPGLLCPAASACSLFFPFHSTKWLLLPQHPSTCARSRLAHLCLRLSIQISVSHLWEGGKELKSSDCVTYSSPTWKRLTELLAHTVMHGCVTKCEALFSSMWPTQQDYCPGASTCGQGFPLTSLAYI